MPRPDDEDREEGFLGRWARRKREAQQPAQPAAEPAPTGTEPASEAAAAEPEAEMVEPPSLDLIDKDFDLAHWLKQNVPEEWKLKALRRAWESDPAISGYLDPARDYALDWNTPGGAPGYGPLSESDNVEEMLANIFGKPPEPAAEPTEPVRNDVAVVQPSSSEAEAEHFAALQREAGGEPLPTRLSGPEISIESSEIAAKPAPAGEVSSAAPQNRAEIPRLRRRGGGAAPL
jgi:hypothetical protein